MFKVDYLSWTIKSEGLEAEPNSHKVKFVFGMLPDFIDTSDLEVSSVKRTGFNWSLAGEGLYIFIAEGYVLVEFTGQGCNRLEADGNLLKACFCAKERCTRIDVAVDIETETRPDEFIAGCDTRSTARGTQVSETGHTEYVGSKKSDRTCKVYRYNEPHPRSHLLRIEYTYRREQARIVINRMIEGQSVKDIALAMGASYGWSHPCYEFGEFEPIKAWIPERRSGKTVSWIYSQCVPAIGKLIADGIITEDEILEAIRSAANGR